jgi:hypothetical protein
MMLTLLSLLTLAQAAPMPTPSPTPTPTPTPQEVVLPQTVRPLPGQLDQVPVFNSNSPELIGAEGILLSTFPAEGKQVPTAHLNFPFRGRFDVFAHHVFRAIAPDNLTTMYLGVILHNPGRQAVTVDVLQAASYLSQPDAPFVQLPPVVDNSLGTVYAGPGGRAMNDILRGQRDTQFPPQLVIPPGGYEMLLNLPIPVATLDPPLNGRSTYMRIRSSDTVYAASLALFARQHEDGSERAPSLEEWRQVLQTGALSTPRDRTPTPPEATGAVVYGRVAGVALGSQWNSQVTDAPGISALTIPASGEAFSYGISTLIAGRLGTGQVQSAEMLVRYPDTAYQAHGNYGIQYDLSLPLQNPTGQPQTVTLSLQTPIKEDTLSRGGLRFFEPLPTQTFFRGTVRIRYSDEQGLPRTRYVHLVERRGDRSEPLVTLVIPPGDRRLVEVSLLYPPDSTPPQVLTVRTE